MIYAHVEVVEFNGEYLYIRVRVVVEALVSGYRVVENFNLDSVRGSIDGH